MTATPNLFVMDTTGTDLFRLTDNPADDTIPTGGLPPSRRCFAVTNQANAIDVRVGPGTNRGVFGSFPANQDIRVIGQAYDSENVVWWEIDESQIPGGTEAGSLWVNSDDVGEKGDCLAVVRVEAPPIVMTSATPVRPAPGDRADRVSAVTPANASPRPPANVCGIRPPAIKRDPRRRAVTR